MRRSEKLVVGVLAIVNGTWAAVVVDMHAPHIVALAVGVAVMAGIKWLLEP